MVYAQTRICPRELNIMNIMKYKILFDFQIRTDQLIPARKPDLELINKKKEIDSTC